MSVVPIGGLILDMRRGNRNAALTLFRRVVDLIERDEVAADALRENLGDRRSKRRLAMVNVADGAHIDVGACCE